MYYVSISKNDLWTGGLLNFLIHCTIDAVLPPTIKLKWHTKINVQRTYIILHPSIEGRFIAQKVSSTITQLKFDYTSNWGTLCIKKQQLESYEWFDIALSYIIFSSAIYIDFKADRYSNWYFSIIKSHSQISRKVRKFHCIFSFFAKLQDAKISQNFFKFSFHSFYLNCKQK